MQLTEEKNLKGNNQEKKTIQETYLIPLRRFQQTSRRPQDYKLQMLQVIEKDKVYVELLYFSLGYLQPLVGEKNAQIFPTFVGRKDEEIVVFFLGARPENKVINQG